MSDAVVPLAWQIANPPFLFVGRAHESERLAAVLARAPVAILWGFSGAGKSALLSAVLAASFPDARARTLVVDAHENADVVALALRRASTILQDLGPRSHDAPSGQDATALVETIERADLWVVVENLERVADAPGLVQALAAAQRHARRARIVCVCREDPRMPELAPQTLQVALLPDADLRALLDAVQPGLPDKEARDVVRRAAGSPWRLLQLSLGASDDDDAGPEKSLLALSPIALGLLRSLALVAVSVPMATLERAVRLPDRQTLEMLARRGYVEQSPRGLRVHDAARALVAASADDGGAVRAQRLLRAVVETGDAELCAGVIALARATNDEDAIVGVLARHGDALRAAGHAAELFAALMDTAPAPRGASYAWACRLACDVGDAALAAIAPPPDDDVDDGGQLRSALFAHVCAARGAIAAACVRAARVAGDARAAPTTKLSACEVLLACRADPADALALGRIAPVAPADVLRQRAAIVISRAPSDDDDDEGARTAAELHRGFSALPRSEQRAHGALVARALRLLDRPRDAAAVCSRVEEDAGAAWCSTRRGLLLERGRGSLELGELPAAEDAFARAAAGGPALSRVEARLGLHAVRLARGELAGLDAALAATSAELLERLVPRPTAELLDDLRACLASLDARPGAAPRLPSGARGRRDLKSAREALVEGDAAEALVLARKARGRARDDGRAIAALEAGVLCTDAALLAGDASALAAHAEQLDVESARIDSRRFALEARFAVGVVESGGEAPAVDALVVLARAMDANPVVARRAAALLGEDVRLDALDRRIVAALTSHAAGPPQTLAQTAGPAWTVDADLMRILLDDGRQVDLAQKKVLFDLLVALCRHGGAATKEQLLQTAWGVRDYHPLQHDNRLKVAVRKLRRLLEEALGDDPIEAVGDGYRLRGRVRFLAADRA